MGNASSGGRETVGVGEVEGLGVGVGEALVDVAVGVGCADGSEAGGVQPATTAAHSTARASNFRIDPV